MYSISPNLFMPLFSWLHLPHTPCNNNDTSDLFKKREKEKETSQLIALNVNSTVANVPAETGIARNKVGAIPFQNPLAPSLIQVCAKALLILPYRLSAPNPSVCIFDLITSNGYEAIHNISPANPPYSATFHVGMSLRITELRRQSEAMRYSKERNQAP